VNTWRVIVATMAIFAAGVVTGGMLTLRVDRLGWVRRQHATRPAQPFTPGGSRLEFLRRAQRELDLSPEQQERVDRLLKESQERNRKILEPVAPQLGQELQRAREEFKAVLTPEQQKRFEELLKKQAHPREPRRPQGVGTGTN
jgi:hypothetical protein